MPSPKKWWRRAAATAKDKRSLFLTRISTGGHRLGDLESAVIRATNHDERSADYKHAGHVFAWARASPSLLPPLMWALARRASRTRSWPVAVKALLLAHGLLLLPTGPHVGRLPFDLSDFRCRSARSWGFSAFVRAYFNFLDNRSLFHLKQNYEEEEEIERVERLQALLDLLLQIRPYADGMDVALVLEAMDCVVIEIFEVYSGICDGIARFLVGIAGAGGGAKGLVGIRVLKRAAEQSSQLSGYFELCRRMGVLNAAELPPVETIPEEDVRDLERLVMEGISGSAVEKVKEKRPETVVTDDWVVFDEEREGGHFGNPFVCSGEELIELM